MACPRDTKSIVGEVHLMEEENDENEFLVDANGLDIPQGEISVYKDPCGELVLVVHTDDAGPTSKSKPVPEKASSTAEGGDSKKSAELANSCAATSTPGDNQAQSIEDFSGTVGILKPTSPQNRGEQQKSTCEQPQDQTKLSTTTSEKDTVKAVPIVDEPMEVDNESYSRRASTDKNPVIKTQETLHSIETTDNLPLKKEEMEKKESLHFQRLKGGQSKEVPISEGLNEMTRSPLSQTIKAEPKRSNNRNEVPTRPEILQSSDREDTSGPSEREELSSCSFIEAKKLLIHDKIDETLAVTKPQRSSLSIKSDELLDPGERFSAGTTEHAANSNMETMFKAQSSMAHVDDVAENNADGDSEKSLSKTYQEAHKSKIVEVSNDTLVQTSVLRELRNTLLINNNNRENKNTSESKMTAAPEETMEAEQESANTTLVTKPTTSSEADPTLGSVAETVEIIETSEEVSAILTEQNMSEALFGAVADDNRSTADEVEGPPKKKRGRPSKRQTQPEDDASEIEYIVGEPTNIAPKSQSNDDISTDNGSNNDTDNHNVTSNGDDETKMGRKFNSRSSSAVEAPRRSGRERQTKRYEDYVDESWGEDGEEEDEGGEGDGLTSQERHELDKKLQQRVPGARRGRGTSRNAAIWVKKCNIIIGETATLNRSSVKSKKVQPVKEIEQPPPKPAQAIIRRYLSMAPLKPEQAASHCRFMYRPQDTFGVDMAQKRKRGMQDDYTCCKCQYWTSRINNYIRHLRDLCPFNKDFFAWDEGMLKEVTRSQKATTTASTGAGSSRKADSKIMASTTTVGHVSDGDLSDRHTHPHSKEQKEIVRSGAGEKAAIEPRDGHSIAAPNPRGKSRKGASEDRSTPSDEVGDVTEREVSARLGFRKHDIVWADLGKGVHWPALVLNIRNRGLQGKARANTMQVKVYLVHDGETRSLPLTKVDGFDSPRRQSYLEIGRGGRGALAVDHARAAQKANKFLRERVLGTNIDPIRFFCLGETKPIDNHEDSSTSPDEDEGVTEEGAGDTAGRPPQWSLPQVEPLPIVIGDQHRNTNGSNTGGGNDVVQALHIVKKAKRRRKLNNMALVDFIVNGKVEPHLVGIYRGTVPSERHASFMSSDEARRTALKKSTSWGPVDDVGQQEAVFEYCEDLFQRSVGDSEGSSGAENSAEQLDKHTYAFEVFCPEAITKAISRLAFVDMDTAAQIFLRGHEQSRQFIDIQELAIKEQELERVAQKGKEETIEREKQNSKDKAVRIATIPAIFSTAPLDGDTAGDQQNVAHDDEQYPEIIEEDEDDNGGETDRKQQINSVDLVREELARRGVDQKLLEVLDQGE